MDIKILYDYFLKANQVVIDTRKIKPNDIFIGIKGTQVDGNEFADKAIEMGCLAAITDNRTYENKGKNIFYVDSSIQTLQDLAKYHRSQLKIPVIALTGSNGKTTTKELIASVLSEKYKVLYTEGNLNNHLGVPLTLLSIKPEHEIAVIEMGANHQQEIEFLCEIAQPDIGYITNFGKAHLEGFGGFEGVIKGKSELYRYLRDNHKRVLINKDDELQVQLSNGINTVTFGENGDYQYSMIIGNDNKVGIKYKDNEIESNLTGLYNFTNLEAATTLGFIYQVDIQRIKSGIEHYFPQNHRSQILERNQTKIIMDTYNANPSSMNEAIKNLSRFSGKKKAILGDMFELGEESHKEHQNIVDIIEKLDIEVILIGKEFYHTNSSASKIKKYLTKEDYLINNQSLPKTDYLLIKGSRGMALETLI